MGPIITEFLGTMFIVFIIFATNCNYLAIGAATAIAVLLGKSLSGAAFNPVVAMALYLSGKITKQYLFPYIFIEILGGLTGFYLYTKIISKS